MRYRYKILASALILGLIISLGFDFYYYLAMVGKQAVINNMRGRVIVAWAGAMGTAGYYLKNATTNIDVAGVGAILRTASNIGLAGESDTDDLYWYTLSFTATWVEEDLFPYMVGSPSTVKHINPTAIEMFGNLSEKIENVTHLIFMEDIDLTRRDGVNPTQLLTEKGILDDIINYCTDIRSLSHQIYNFNPKFQ